MYKQHTRPVRRVLAVILSLALLMTFTPLSGLVTLTARAASGDFTEFLDCSSGSATGYFTCNDHFYKVEFTGINTSQHIPSNLEKNLEYLKYVVTVIHTIQ